MRISFNRMEWAGSVGDLGTLLPLAFAMIMINGLSPTGLFLSIGLLYVVGGLYYRVPIAVQPMKVVSAYAIAQALSPGVITASGLLMAAFLLVLGTTGLVNHVAKIVPKAVIRGVQLTTGVLLLSKGVQMVVGSSGFQAMRGSVEPFLAIQSIGPIPMSLVIGATFLLVTMFLLGSRRYPAGLVVVVCGALAGAALGAWRELATLSPGLHFPEFMPFGIPTGADFSFALLALVLPQVPMTMGNAVIANRDLSFEYFGEESRRVTDRNLCLSMGFANVFAALVGGMPICHGAGGLAAHYRFGARTCGSNIIIGVAFLLLALLLGSGSVNVLHLLPMGVLGVLLFFSGTQLALTILDVESRTDLFLIVAMLGITLPTNLAWAFGAGIVLHHIFRKGNVVV
ncbi:putative sulfate/molybdate transporter [Pseudodesulfovibrio sp. zrk46]|uniref:putative sulfate/molybdate transporter n=1 Tax=Pseudodesulfovibrio sp. zrk46 TaxID=2725288 RepID=UPI001449843F|nr:putative sulfate/molybdate transporter [Pseudodesulfovibrio sp. zrk46]QJB56987.1 sulfate permease [Pseudodesulfovibrio sp. zrk46]